MKFAVITAYDNGMDQVGRITSFTKKRYCDKHGYTFIERKLYNLNYHPAWARIYFILELLAESRFDWILWTDADAFIANNQVKFEQILPDLLFDEGYYLSEYPDVANAILTGWPKSGYIHYLECGKHENRKIKWMPHEDVDFVISTDINAQNSGVFLLRCSDWSQKFFTRVLELQKIFPNYPGDQIAIFQALYQDKWVKNKVSVTTQRVFNSYYYHLYKSRHPNGFPLGDYQEGDFIVHLPAIDNITRYHIVRTHIIATLKQSFDEDYYIKTHEDIKENGFIHYLDCGQYENRKCKWFD